ncbi:hypothetical protein [Streptomyces flaveolus]|uniref:hypothetical protein n=1 Tax=Streptomyces flaveolus TaxID=67297 RepID=UPI0033F2F336
MTHRPACPHCSTSTTRIDVDGEDVWLCNAPDCARRTYGTGDPDDDDMLPTYTTTDDNGTTTIYHGTGSIDIEATAELAAQTGSDEDE